MRALLFTVSTSLNLDAAPRSRAGAAAAVGETSAELGYALGIATMGALGTVVYRLSLDQTVADPSDAREGIVAAVDAFADSPDPHGMPKSTGCTLSARYSVR